MVKKGMLGSLAHENRKLIHIEILFGLLNPQRNVLDPNPKTQHVGSALRKSSW